MILKFRGLKRRQFKERHFSRNMFRKPLLHKIYMYLLLMTSVTKLLIAVLAITGAGKQSTSSDTCICIT
jgi:hypothetical protein